MRENLSMDQSSGPMNEPPTSVRAFGVEHAKRYDEVAELLMGDRPRQRQYLADLLRCLPEEPRTFVELACGTGYFTEVFFEVFPEIRGIAFDGSEAMLEQARARFPAGDRNLELQCKLLQTMDWSVVEATPLIFSAFAFHHLPHDEKGSLFRRIFEHLEPSGHFILFDSFRPDDQKADEIIERLACLDIERRVRNARGVGATAREHHRPRPRGESRRERSRGFLGGPLALACRAWLRRSRAGISGRTDGRDRRCQAGTRLTSNR